MSESDTKTFSGPQPIKYKEGDIRWVSIDLGACFAKETIGADGQAEHVEYTRKHRLNNPEESMKEALENLNL